jgi:hypothetical protein
VKQQGRPLGLDDHERGIGPPTEDDPDFDRLIELDDAYWTFRLPVLSVP